jgi:hypothetical protein
VPPRLARPGSGRAGPAAGQKARHRLAAPMTGRVEVQGQPGAAGKPRCWRGSGQVNRSGDGSLPSGKDIDRQHGRHERWGRLVKRSGLAGELDPQT